LEERLTANREVKSGRRLRGILKVIKTILHVGECSIHGVKVGGLGVKVEGEKLRGRHRKMGYKNETEWDTRTERNKKNKPKK